MRIGIYLGEFAPGDGGSYTFQSMLCQALSSLETPHRFCIFHYGDTPPPGDCTTLETVTLKKPDISGRNSLTLWEAEAEFPVDFMWYLSPVYELSRSPFLYTVWDLQHHVQPYFPEVSTKGWTWDAREALYRRTIPKATAVLTGNSQGKQEILTYYTLPAQRVLTIPFPTPPFALASSSASSTSFPFAYFKPFLFYPAQFWPHKNHIVLLLALKKLRQEDGIPLRLVLSGTNMGNQEYIQNQISALGLDDCVHLLGFVSQEVLVMLYQNAFALVYPSFFGPNNLPPLEAFALECPVIAADVPGVREQLGNAATYCDPKDEHAWRRQILSWWRKPSQRKPYRKKGLALARSWTAEQYVLRVLTYLESLLPIRRCWPMSQDLQSKDYTDTQNTGVPA